MNRFTLLLILALWGALSSGEGREGHGGDPDWYQFQWRAQFGEYSMTRNASVPDALLARYREALAALRFELTDDALVTPGRVLPDPERPGKNFVRVSRARFRAALSQIDRVGVTEFVVHEVFETVDLDINREITGQLFFRDADFIRWMREVYHGDLAPASSPGFWDRDQPVTNDWVRLQALGALERAHQLTPNFNDPKDLTLCHDWGWRQQQLNWDFSVDSSAGILRYTAFELSKAELGGDAFEVLAAVTDEGAIQAACAARDAILHQYHGFFASQRVDRSQAPVRDLWSQRLRESKLAEGWLRAPATSGADLAKVRGSLSRLEVQKAIEGWLSQIVGLVRRIRELEKASRAEEANYLVGKVSGLGEALSYERGLVLHFHLPQGPSVLAADFVPAGSLADLKTLEHRIRIGNLPGSNDLCKRCDSSRAQYWQELEGQLLPMLEKLRAR